MTRVISSSGRGQRLMRLLLCGVFLVAMQGCSVIRKVMEPGVRDPKPLTAEEASQLSDEQIGKRVDYVTQRLEDNRTHAAWWYYGFLTLNAGGMVAGAATA